MLSKNAFIIFCCVLFIYGYSSAYIGLPAYPMLQHYFHTDAGHVKWSMTIFLLGYAVSQLFWGAYSDRFGRRTIVLIGTVVTILGSCITAFAPTISAFIVGRFVEAIGVGFTPVMARAILADSLDQKILHRAMTFVVGVVAILPAVAPLVGGQIIHLFDAWQPIYYFLAIAGFVFLVYEYFKLHETHLNKVKKLSLRHVFEVYFSILTHSHFMGYFLTISLMLGGLVTFYAIAPYIFISHLNMAPNTYGFVLIFIGVCYMVGSFFSHKLSHRLPLNKIILCGYAFTFLSAISFFVFLSFYHMTLLSVVIPMMLYAFGCGFISPTSNACAMSVIKSHYGSLAAILGAGSILASSILNAILARFSLDTLFPLAIFIIVVNLISGAIFYFAIIKPKFNPEA